LVVHLLVGVAYVIGAFAGLMIFIDPAWVYQHFACSAAKSLHTAFFFTLFLVAVDIGAHRWGPRKLAYNQRTVGGQWQVMLVAFLLAYASFRASFLSLLSIYAQWAANIYMASPQIRMTLAVEFLGYLIGWMITAGLVIQFALRSQRLAALSRDSQASGTDGFGDDIPAAASQTQPGCFIHFAANQNLRIPFSEIVHISVEDHYCRLVHKNGEKLKSHLLRMPLNQLENELPRGQFARIHRSHIVNLQHVLGWRMVRRQRLLVMEHGAQLPISRTRLAELKPDLSRLGLPKLK
jgi:DNA-binding LytR/AlgR family response regulator